MGRLISIASLLTATFSFIVGGDSLEQTANPVALTTSNFNQILQNNDYVLVKFYTPLCPHCKAFAPEYIKVANLLEIQKPMVKVAEVDGSREKSLIAQNNIQGYPTIKFYRNGKPTTFSGPRNAEDIVAWVIRNM